jgi:hypothetical protein
MKKKLFLNLLIFFTLTTTFSQNLVVNGDFETGDTSSWTSKAGMTAQQVEVNSGAWAVELRNTNQAYFGQIFPQNGGSDPSVDFLPTNTYIIKAFVKGDGGINGEPGDAYLSVQFKQDAAASYEYLNYINVKTNSDAFQEFSFKVNATVDQLESIRVAYYHPGGSGLYWIDDISVTPVSGGASDNDIIASANGNLDAVNKKITIDVSIPVTKTNFVNGLSLSNGAQAQVFTSDSRQVGDDEVISNENTVKVFAENGTYQVYTIDQINDEKIISVSGVAILDNVNNSITNIPNPSTAFELISSLTLSAGASAEILDAGTPISETDLVSASMILKVTGANAATQDYSLALSATVLTNVALNKTATYLRYSNDDTSSYGDPALITDGVKLGDNTQRVYIWIASSPVGAEVVIDLGQDYTISQYKTHSGSAGAYGGPMIDFTFDVWDITLNDGAGGWRLVDTVKGNTKPLFVSNIPEETTSKVRYVVTAAIPKYLNLFEMEVFGTTTLSIADEKFNNFSLYPNPTNGDFLTIKSPNTTIESVKVVDVLGKQFNVSLENNRINVSKLNAGLYLIKINNSKAFKFIKK